MSTNTNPLLTIDMKRIIALLSAVTLLILMFAAMPASAGNNKSYRIGDADGNSVVELVDATLIQKAIILDGFDSDGMIALRGDCNGDGLDIADATAVQRYTLGLACYCSVGKWVYPEETTVAPTQTPTLDEYELPFVT